jgi:hypothetical protein
MSTASTILKPIDLLSLFVKRLQEFPSPTEEPTMLYNYNKLMIILQNREISTIEPNETIVENAHSLATQFSDITKRIMSKQLTDAQFNVDYDQLQRKIENELTGAMYLFARQWGISVKALFYYKNFQYEKAIDLSLECIILNEYLIKKGIDTLLFRAAEQNKNIVRVLFRQHRITEACQLTRSLFSFLFTGATEGLYGSIFSDPEYWNRVPYVREGYAYEMFRAIVSMIMSLEKNQGLGEKAFRDIFSTLKIDVDTPDRLIISEWIAIKKKFYEKDLSGFFELLNAFFETPLCKIYDVIKISLLLDVCSLVEDSYDRTGDLHCRSVIFEYINEYLNGQFYLKTDLSARNLVTLTN